MYLINSTIRFFTAIEVVILEKYGMNFEKCNCRVGFPYKLKGFRQLTDLEIGNFITQVSPMFVLEQLEKSIIIKERQKDET